MQTIHRTSAALRAALVSLIAALGVAALGASAHAQSGTLAHSTKMLRKADTGWVQLTNTATSGSMLRGPGNRGTVMACGLFAATSHEAISCVGTSTNIRPSGVVSTLRILLDDGNTDDTLTWDNVDIVLQCDNVVGDKVTYSFTNVDLTETACELGVGAGCLEDKGRVPYCGVVSRFAASTNDNLGEAGEAFTFDTSDSIRLVSTDTLVAPIAPARSASLVESVCIRGDIAEDFDVACAKASDCTTALVDGGRQGVAVNVSTCFGSGDAVELSAEQIEGAFVRIVGRAGTF